MLPQRCHTGLYSTANSSLVQEALNLAQALSHCVPLATFFLDCSGRVELAGADSLAFLTRDLMQLLWSGKYEYCSPSKLYRAVVIRNPAFAGYGQHDSHELLRVLLDGLDEELELPTAFQCDVTPPSPCYQLTLCTANTKESIIRHLFSGRLSSHVCCDVCGAVVANSSFPSLTLLPRCRKLLIRSLMSVLSSLDPPLVTTLHLGSTVSSRLCCLHLVSLSKRHRPFMLF